LVAGAFLLWLGLEHIWDRSRAVKEASGLLWVVVAVAAGAALSIPAWLFLGVVDMIVAYVLGGGLFAAVFAAGLVVGAVVGLVLLGLRVLPRGVGQALALGAMAFSLGLALRPGMFSFARLAMDSDSSMLVDTFIFGSWTVLWVAVFFACSFAAAARPPVLNADEIQESSEPHRTSAST
jgi:hypothetical protein